MSTPAAAAAAPRRPRRPGGDGRPATAARTRREPGAAGSKASSDGVRRRMQAQATRDTGPELAVRRLLHAAGLRYRVDRAPLAGLRRRADLVFGPAKVAVFIDGCFWHSCPEHGTSPRTNDSYWQPKLQRNRERDADTDRWLAAAGWLVLRAWAHEDPAAVAARVAFAVHERRGQSPHPGRLTQPPGRRPGPVAVATG